MPPTLARSRPATKKAQATHARLVAKTTEVIQETGAFSGEQVAELAGLSPATFYAYFPSKDEALAAALDAVLGELVDRTLAVFDVARLIEDGLEAVVETAVDVCIEAFSASALVFRLALARLPESRSIRHVYRDHQARSVEALERFIRLGAATGRISATDHAATTTALLVALQGINNPAMLNRSYDATVASMVGMIVHLLDPAHASS